MDSVGGVGGQDDVLLAGTVEITHRISVTGGIGKIGHITLFFPRRLGVDDPATTPFEDNDLLAVAW